jgi:hypothetical protein
MQSADVLAHAKLLGPHRPLASSGAPRKPVAERQPHRQATGYAWVSAAAAALTTTDDQ